MDKYPYDLDAIKNCICKIVYIPKYGSGFFIKLPREDYEGNISFLHCLISCHHVINKEMIDSKNEIKVFYEKEEKFVDIILDAKRRYIKTFTYLNIDATLVEILPSDNISEKYFLLPNLDYIDQYELLKDIKIFALHYPQNMELTLSSGIIRAIDVNCYKFSYRINSNNGSSGGPIFIKGTNTVIGIHKNRDNNELKNGDFLGPIIKSLKNDILYMSCIIDLKKEKEIKDFHNQNKIGASLYFDEYDAIISNSLENLNNLNIIENNELNPIKCQIQIDSKNEKIEGKLYYDNGTYYIGHIKDKNKRHGKGIYYSKDNKPIYEGDFLNNIYEGNGKLIIYEKNIIYNGQFKNGLFHGKGKLLISNFIEYQGSFVHNCIEGYGNIKIKDWGRYIGNLHKSCRHGKGVQMDEFGKIIYDGEFKNDLFDGNGKLIYDEEDYYEGMFKEGNRHGKGKLYHKYKDNIIRIEYDGDYYNNERNGNGKYIYEDGQFYIGEFKNNKINGEGKLYYSNGNIKYEGSFKNNKADGRGKFYSESDNYYIYPNIIKPQTEYSNALLYEGDFVQDRFEGNGTYYHPNGEISTGQFKNNFREGDIIILYNNRSIRYEGKFKNNLPNGFGKCRVESGAIFEGNFINGDLKKGKMFNSEMELLYEGDLLRMQPNGNGIFFFRDKFAYIGQVKNGRMCGDGIIINSNNKILYKGKFNIHSPEEIIDLLNSLH